MKGKERAYKCTHQNVSSKSYGADPATPNGLNAVAINHGAITVRLMTLHQFKSYLTLSTVSGGQLLLFTY